MSAKFFFFSSLDEMHEHDPEKGYGPRTQSTASEDAFATSQFFSVALASNPAKAVAVCNGQIVLQKLVNGSFNLILRPHFQPPFDFPEIAYFIYRGIKRDSLLTGNGSLLTAAGAPPFIANAVKAYRGEQGDTATPTSGYSDHVLGLVLNPTNSYTDDDPLDALFERRDSNGGVFNQLTQPPFVKAGEFLGDFEECFGFEVVLNQQATPIRLAHVRPLEGILTAPSSSTTGGENFDAASEREKCLNFVDPAAFFASFLGRKLRYWQNAEAIGGASQSADQMDGLWPIVQKFPHHGRVYLDLRDDYGNSLNLLHSGDRQRTVWIQPGPGEFAFPHAVDIKESWDAWPVRFLEYNGAGTVGSNGASGSNSVPNAGEDKWPFFYTYLRLNARGIEQPVLYLSRAHRNRLRKLWPGRKIVDDFEEMLDDKHIECKICLPMADANMFLAGYYKFNLYERKRDFPAVPAASASMPLPLPKDSFITGAFHPRLMVNTLAETGRDMTMKVWDAEVLVNLEAVGGPCYVAKVGIAQDAKSVTYFAVPVHFLEDAFRKEPAPALGGWMNAAENVLQHGGRKPFFLEYLSERNAYQSVVKLPLEDGPTDQLLAFEENTTSRRAGILQANGRLEHCLFLTMSRDGAQADMPRIQTLINGIPDDGRLFWRELVPVDGPIRHTLPDSGLTYIKRELVLARIQENANAPDDGEFVDIPNSTVEVFELAGS